MNDKETEQLVRALSAIIMDSVLALIQNDSHCWSMRPCQTCKAITSITGKKFGCYKYQEENNNK